MKRKGTFIVFEGPDCSGKTTQIKAVYEELLQMNYKVLNTREPGGSTIGKSVRDLMLTDKTIDLCGQSELFLIMADRAQHVKEIISPFLECGAIVLCDRWVESTIAYQGIRKGIDINTILGMHSIASDGVKPDMVFYFNLDSETQRKRLSERSGEPDKTEANQLINDQIRGFYRECSNDNYGECIGDRIDIDCSRSIQEITSTIVDSIRIFLETNKGV